MKVMDSSFLVALFWPDDTLHDKAESAFLSESSTFVLLDRVVEETLTVLTYKMGLKPALEIILRLMHNDRFVIRHLTESQWHEIIEMIGQRDRKIGFTDYAVAYVCSEERCLPMAYDKELLAFVKKERSKDTAWEIDELLYGGNEPHARNFKSRD